jgi:thiol-disulfide isomerase/thioredoxin
MDSNPKNIFLFLFCLLFGASSAFSASVKGKIKSTNPPKKIYLFAFQGDILLDFDSVALKSGKFVFNSKENSFPRGMYKLGFTRENSSSLVLGGENVEMEIDDKNWEEARFSNSEENKNYVQYRTLNTRVNFEMRVLETKYRNLTPLAQKDKAAFDIGLRALQTKADSLMKDFQLKLISFQSESKDLYVGKYFKLLSSEPSTSAENFITAEDFEDLENLRANVWDNRVSTLFQKFGDSDPDKWVILGDQVIKLTRPKTMAREIALRSVAKALQPLEQQGLNAAFEIAKRYSSEIPGTRSTEFLKQFPPGPPSVGEMAPDIALADRDGKPYKLSSLRGKVVLLDFWASWCGPCRQENPTVVKAYNKYESKGFTVFSVSLDQSKEKWLAAIAKDGLIWNNHVSDLKGWGSEGAALYQVRGIPATFLLNKEGKIIAKNLRGSALEEKLKELLEP